jgi:hypothetical protein
MSYNTRMAGVSANRRFLPAVPCRKFRQAMTRSLRITSDGAVLSFLPRLGWVLGYGSGSEWGGGCDRDDDGTMMNDVY